MLRVVFTLVLIVAALSDALPIDTACPSKYNPADLPNWRPDYYAHVRTASQRAVLQRNH